MKSDTKPTSKFEVKTAILVDGAYYRKRAASIAGSKTPAERADELESYCMKHLHDRWEHRRLYRIFYYDCAPINKGNNIYHPLFHRGIDLGLTESGRWMSSFLDELKHRRKFALRLGRLGNTGINYNLKPSVTKELLDGSRTIDSLQESDFSLNLVQKGVDMRIGVDIASIAFKKQVDQIILIAGDSDFVPAAKQARREGIDFILDPMGNHIPDDLFEHIDGIRTPKLEYIARTEEAPSPTSTK